VSHETGAVASTEAQQSTSRGTGILLTVLLTLALAGQSLIAVVVTWLYMSLGWPRAGLVSVITVVILVAWAPVVGIVVAAGRHAQAWWTPSRLALGIASLLASAVVVILFLGMPASG
jgi:hypothetical protein